MEQIETRRSIRIKILVIMLPIIVDSFLQIFAGTVSTAMIGRLSVEMISAQGMSSKFVDIVYFFFKGIGVGLTVYIARSFAQKKMIQVRRYFEETLLTALAIGMAVGVLLFCFPRTILSFYHVDENVLQVAARFMQIVSLCIPSWCVIALATAVYQAILRTRVPLYVSLGVNGCNILLGYMLIFGGFGAPRLGVYGAAISLVIARTTGAIVYLCLLYWPKKGLFRQLAPESRFCTRPVTRELKQVYAMGMPAAGESANWQLCSIVFSVLLLQYGTATFSAYQIALQAEILTNIPAAGFSVATTSLISRSVGLKDREMYRSYSREIYKMSALISLGTSAILWFLPGVIMRVLTSNEELIAIGTLYIFVMGFSQVPQNLGHISCGICRSVGYRVMPVIVHILGIWCVRMPGAFLGKMVFDAPILLVWIFIDLDQLARFIVSTIYLRRKRVYERFTQYANREA